MVRWKFKLIKIFIILILLINGLQSIVKADDISDFEIEGFRVNESLLKHFNKDEIKKNFDKNALRNLNGKYSMSNFMFKIGDYDGIQVVYETQDEQFTALSIAGGIFFNDFTDCLKKKRSISNEIQNLFKNAEIILDDVTKMKVDKSGKSIRNADMYFLYDGIVAVTCTDWSDEITKNFNWSDNLRVNIRTKKFNDELN